MPSYNGKPLFSVGAVSHFVSYITLVLLPGYARKFNVLKITDFDPYFRNAGDFPLQLLYECIKY